MISYRLALDWLLRHAAVLPGEVVPIPAAAGRVSAADIMLPGAPSVAMALIDGVAVRAAETAGASDYTPLPCHGLPVRAGWPVPSDMDAVVPDHAHAAGMVMVPVARGEGVALPGHDVPAGHVLPAGTRLTALHLAMLDSPPAVVRQPVLGGRARPMIQALAVQAGAVLHGPPDLLIDPAPPFQAEIPSIAIRPGETTALGLMGGIPAIRLPVAPADAATIFALLVVPLLRRMGALPEPPRLSAQLSRKITSGLGTVDAIRVRLEDGVATPLGPSEALGLSAAAAANGLVLVPEGSEGYPAGAMVSVIPL